MTISIISVGKRHQTEIAEIIATYEQRISNQYKLEWLLIDAIHDTDRNVQTRKESERIMSKLSRDDYVILLDEHGRQLNNTQLADCISKALASSKSRLVFIIGGAYGVDVRIQNRANLILSLSKLVFPHQLVRILLVEQLYRSLTIIDNHPYHH